MSSTSTEAVPEAMTAVVLQGPGEWALQTIETPELDEVENVICRVRGAAICGSDPKMMTGVLDWPTHYPFVPGHEWAGEVVAVGDGVDRVRPGDRVFGETHSGCGFCRPCRRGRYQLCENFGDDETGHRQIGHTLDGAFAEYVAVPEDLLHPLDDGISWAEAALLDVSAIALHCTIRGGITPGNRVAVVGTGIIGLCMVQQARAMGASQVIATGNPTNNELAADLGADATVSYADDVVGRVDDLTGGQGVDVALEAVGVEEAVRQAVQMTRKGGTVSVDGMPATPEFTVPMRTVVKNELDFRGCRAHAGRAKDAARLVTGGQVDLAPLVSRTYALKDFERAYREFTAGEDRIVRAVLTTD